MSQRVKKVNQLIKEQLSDIILKQMDFSPGTLATVTRVETTPDLRQTKIFISVLPEEKKSQVFKKLKGKIYSLQQELNKRLHMSPVPKIKFIREEKSKKAARIEEILEELKKKEK